MIKVNLQERKCVECGKVISQEDLTPVQIRLWNKKKLCSKLCHSRFFYKKYGGKEYAKYLYYNKGGRENKKEYLKNPEIRKHKNEYLKKYHSNNKDRHNELQRESERKRRIEILNHYSEGKMKCSCCGESHFEFLALDHKNNDGNKWRRVHPKGSQKLYTWIIKNNFPPIFAVLCHNCNSAKAFHGVCPHNK
jgi:hypothetical protein